MVAFGVLYTLAPEGQDSLYPVGSFVDVNGKTYVVNASGVLTPADRPPTQKRLFADEMPVANWGYRIKYRMASSIIGILQGETYWGKWQNWPDRGVFRRRRAAEAAVRYIRKSGRFGDEKSYEFLVSNDYLGHDWAYHMRRVLRARKTQLDARKVKRLREEGKIKEADALAEEMERPSGSVYFSKRFVKTPTTQTPFEKWEVNTKFKVKQNDWFDPAAKDVSAPSESPGAFNPSIPLYQYAPNVSLKLEELHGIIVEAEKKSGVDWWKGGKQEYTIHDETITVVPAPEWSVTYTNPEQK